MKKFLIFLCFVCIAYSTLLYTYKPSNTDRNLGMICDKTCRWSTEYAHVSGTAGNKGSYAYLEVPFTIPSNTPSSYNPYSQFYAEIDYLMTAPSYYSGLHASGQAGIAKFYSSPDYPQVSPSLVYTATSDRGSAPEFIFNSQSAGPEFETFPTCQTLTLSNLQATIGKELFIKIEYQNSNENTDSFVPFYYVYSWTDSNGNTRSYTHYDFPQMMISEVRIYAYQNCLSVLSSVTLAPNGTPKNSYIAEATQYGSITDLNKLFTGTCPVCTDQANSLIGHSGNYNAYCLREYDDGAYLDFTFSDPIEATGVEIIGGRIYLFGPSYGSNDMIEVTLGGNVWVSPKVSDFGSDSLTFTGEKSYCYNCMYNSWNFTTTDFSAYALGASNTFRVYFHGTRDICVAGAEIELDLKDIQGPTLTCQSVVSITITPSDVNGGNFSVTNLNYVTKVVDNCDVGYQAPSDYYSVQTVNIYDYPSVTQTVTVPDSLGNKGTCNSTINISLNPPLITYPPPNSNMEVDNIVITWANYSPTIESGATVDIWVTGPNTTVYLGTNLPYYIFELYYRNDIYQLQLGNAYRLHLKVTSQDQTQSVTFFVDNITFVSSK